MPPHHWELWMAGLRDPNQKQCFYQYDDGASGNCAYGVLYKHVPLDYSAQPLPDDLTVDGVRVFTVVTMNDNHNFPLAKIADILEACTEEAHPTPAYLLAYLPADDEVSIPKLR